MDWLNIILEHISKHDIENITKLEKDFLTKYDSVDKEYLENELTIRYEFYNDFCDYKITHDNWTVTKEDLKYTRLNMLWDNMEMDDSDTFCKIYDIPKLFMNLTWSNFPNKYKKLFEEYWISYYNFNL